MVQANGEKEADHIQKINRSLWVALKNGRSYWCAFRRCNKRRNKEMRQEKESEPNHELCVLGPSV